MSKMLGPIVSNNLENIYEDTFKELRRKSWPSVVRRVKQQKLKSYFLGVSKKGIVNFKTTSGTTAGKFWNQQIKFLDLRDAIDIQREDKSMKNRDIVNLMVYGNIAVYCNCTAFKYWGWQYINWKNGTGIKRENRFPKKRNRSLTGSSCKHLISVFDVLPFYINDIVRQYRKYSILK